MTCKSMTFGEVPVGSYFGKGDYFHYKNSPVTAVMDASGEQNEWEQSEVVYVDEGCAEIGGVL